MRTTGALLSPVRVRFDYASCVRPTTATRWPTGHTVHASLDRSGRPRRLPERVQRGCSRAMKALVTGVAGFIGSTLAERLARGRRRRRRHRLLHRLLPAGDQGAQLARASTAPALPVRRIEHPGRRPRRAPADRTHVFHLAAQAGVRKSWGRDFAVYTVNNIEATQVAARGVRRASASSGSSTRRARRSTATTSAMPMREDALPQPVSPYGVTKLAAEQLCYLYLREPRRADRVAALLHGLRAAPAARHGLSRSSRGAFRASRSRVFGDGEQTRDFTFVDGCGERDDGGGGDAGIPGRVYNIGGGSRVSVNEVLEMIGRVSGRQPVSRRRSGPEGRHAAHVCRHVAGARRLGFARPSSSKQGLAAEYQWLIGSTLHDDEHERARLRRSSLAVVRGRRPVCARAVRSTRAARHGPARPVPVRARQRGARTRRSGSRRASTSSRSPKPTRRARYRPDAKLGVGDTYLGEGTAEALVLAINEFQEFLVVLPDATRAPTTRSTSWAWRTSARCARRSATRPRRARPSASSRRSSTRYPNSEPDAGGQGASCARRAIA